MKKLELVAPGGSLEKIEYAYYFGADAVYAGRPDFSLRARINEFTEKKLEKAVKLARKFGKKIYFTLNIYAHEWHLPKIKKHLEFIKKIKPDAIIISDPGIINLARKIAPGIKIHLSTQANVTSSEAARFWEKQSVSRIILAREVTLSEIKKIRRACPQMELEYFVHGAMCMSYSGRCLLSRWMRNRSANLGDCVQPCRWQYRLSKMSKVKCQKCGAPQSGTENLYADDSKIMTVEEDEHGTYLFNSKDLCLIEHIEELAKAGINSFKIEGRTKSVYYVACAVKAYQQVLNAIRSRKSKPEIKKISSSGKKELEKLVNRGYSTGFLLGKNKWENDFEKSHQTSQFQFVGEIIGGEKNNRVHPVESRRAGAALPQFNRVKAHNSLEVSEIIEIISPESIYRDKIKEIRNSQGKKVRSAHGGGKSFYFIRFSRAYPEKSMIRKKSGFG